MITADQLRALALALPDTEEKSHFGQADFRVGGKIFGGLSRDNQVANLKLSPEAQAMLMDGNPKGFSPASGAWGARGWTLVHLAHVELDEVRELVAEAFRLTAKPKRKVARKR